MKNSRRDFVIKSALAAGGIACSYNSVAAFNAEVVKPFTASFNDGPARICFFSKDLPGLGYDELAAIVAETGFDGIDLTVRKNGHVLPENVERDLPLAVSAAKKRGIMIYMIATDIIDADEQFTESIIKTAASLGIGYYRMGPRFYDQTKTIPQNLEDFKIKYEKLAKLNQKYKIRGECQNHSGIRFGAALWDQWEVLKDMNPQWVGIQYDLLHASLEGVNSWPLGFKLIQPYIGTMDMKDFYWQKTEKGWEEVVTPLGEGMIDFKRFFVLLKKNNMQGPFSLHCEYLSDKDDLHSKTAKMKKDITTLRGWIKQAGL